MSDRLFVGTRKGLFEFRRPYGGEWTIASTSFMGSPVSMVLADGRDETLFATLELGHFGVKLHRSQDDGVSWHEIAAPSYTGVDPDAADPPSLKLLWSLETGGPDEPGVLWAGTIPGGLFRSEDRGESWVLNRPLWDDPLREQWLGGGYDKPGIHSISVDPRDSRRLAIGVSCGGVWETLDGGMSWRIGGEGIVADFMPPEQAGNPAIQDAHRLVRCAGAPDHYWIQHHNGIFRADQGIGNWVRIMPPNSGFGFAAAVHPAKPDRAWFVPAVKDEFRYPTDGRFVIARTSDGGASFEIISEGLPQHPAYDLVYRHGLDVDASGERLAMGSTTGGLWTSDDGGDRWVQSPVRLPPVYVVRFG